MKKQLIILLGLIISNLGYGQILQAGYSSPLTEWEKEGWKIQSHSFSFDGQTIVFSAKKPQQSNYDLYILAGTGDVVALSSLNTSSDELYPSLSSNGQDILFVRRNIETKKGKITNETSYLMSSRCENTHWMEPEVIVVSEGDDISPLMFSDNKTVIFASRRQAENKKDNNYALFYTRRIDERNWFNPRLIIAPENKNDHYYAPHVERMTHHGTTRIITLAYTHQICSHRDTTYVTERMILPEQFHPQAILTLKGRIRDIKTHRMIPHTISVYNAISFKPFATITSGSPQEYKVALPYGIPYFIDVTGADYSHYYAEYDCRQLLKDTTIVLNVELDRKLNIRINTFDKDMLLPILPDSILLNGRRMTKGRNSADLQLEIGKMYDITYKKKGYDDVRLCIDTKKNILLTESELDVEMEPSKTEMVVQLLDADSLYKVAGTIAIRNKDKDEELVNRSEDSTLFQVRVRQGDTYMIYARAKGYVYKDTVFHIPYSNDTILCDIPLAALRKEMVLQLRNIHFDHNSYALTQSSYEELDKLVKLMQDNPSMRIELSAHTDDVGDDKYNQKLSQRRGESAVRYLIRQGIESARIDAKGYGKSKPLVPNDSDENRAINRRVEFTIKEIE